MVWSVLLATLPITIAGINIFKVYQKDSKESITQIQKEKASLVVERISGFIREKTNILIVIARDDSLRDPNVSRLDSHLKNFLFKGDHFLEIGLLDDKGREKFSISTYEGGIPAEQKDQSMTPLFQAVSKKQVYYGNFHYTSDGKQTVMIGVPVEKPDGRLIGVLKARVYLNPMTDLLHETRIGEKGSAYVMDSMGYLIAHPKDQNVILGPFVDKVIAGEEGSVEFENLRKEKFLIVYKPIPELKWGVVVQVPAMEAYASLDELTRAGIK